MAVWLGKLTVAIAVGILLMLLLLLLDAFLAFVFFFERSNESTRNLRTLSRTPFLLELFEYTTIEHGSTHWSVLHTITPYRWKLILMALNTRNKWNNFHCHYHHSNIQFLYIIYRFSPPITCVCCWFSVSLQFFSSLNFQLFLDPTERCFSLLYYVINLLTNITLVSNLFIL